MANTVAGVQQRFQIKAESAYDTPTAFAVTDAVDLIELKIEPELNYTELAAHTGTSSQIARIEGKRGGKWSLSSFIRPVAAGTQPDIGPLLLAAIGDYASNTYTCDEDDDINLLQFGRYAGDNLYEVINGCWVEEIEFECKGGEPPKITASGGFASYGMVMGGGTVSGSQAAAQTVIEVATGDSKRYRPGAFIKFGSTIGALDNAGAGYRITAVTYTGTEAITITPGLAVADALSGGEAITPLQGTVALHFAEVNGSVIGGIACDLTVGGTSIGFIDGKVNVKTGIRALNGEATTNRPNRLVRGKRAVTGEAKCYALNESNLYLGGAWNGTLAAINFRFGANTSGARIALNSPNAQIDVSPIEIPESEEATYSLKFVSLQSTTAGDELAVVTS